MGRRFSHTLAAESRSQVEVRQVVLQTLSLLALAILGVLALDHDADLLEDTWEETHGFSTNAYAPTNLVGWWQLDHTNGIVAVDRSANLWDLDAINDSAGMWVTNGAFHEAFDADGLGRHLRSPTNATYSASNLTFSIWLRTSQTNTVAAIATWHDAQTNGWELGMTAEGRARALFFTPTNSVQEVVSTNQPPYALSDGNWHHVALTYNGSSKAAKVYVDGELEAEGAIVGEVPTDPEAIRIAAEGTGTWLVGTVDEVRLYNRDLTESEVSQLPETYSDPDGDGWNNLIEMQEGTDPHNADSDGDSLNDSTDAYPLDWYNNVAASLDIISGSNQAGDPGLVASSPLRVRVTQSGSGLNGAPVKCKVTKGAGQIGNSGSGPWVNELTATADSSGYAEIWFKFGSDYGVRNRVAAEAGPPSSLDTETFFATPGFVPPTNGLHMWLRADEGITTDGSGNISEWHDESGNAFHAIQTNSAMRPAFVTNAVNGLPCALLDGSNDHLSLGQAMDFERTDSFTMLLVVRPDSTGGNGAMISKLLNSGTYRGHELGYLPGTQTVRRYLISTWTSNGFNKDFTTQANDAYHAMCSLYDGSSSVNGATFRVDGVPITGINGNVTGPSATTKHTGIASLGSREGLSGFFKGHFVEVLVYSRMLSEAELFEAGSYLSFKFDLTPPPVPAPVSSEPTGIFGGPINVTLTSPVSEVTIRYTTDGSEPTTSSPIHTDPINITTTTTLKYKSYYSSWGTSDTITRVYTIDSTTAEVPRTGMKVWLRGDVGVEANGSNQVSRWANQADSLFDATQSSANLQPIWATNSTVNMPVMRFNGSTQYFTLGNLPGYSNQTGMTGFAVSISDTGTGDRRIISKYAGSGDHREWMLHLSLWNVQETYTVAGYQATTTVPYTSTTDPSLLRFGWKPGHEATLYRDGEWLGTAAKHVYHMDARGAPLRIGWGEVSTAYYDGDIAEIILFDRQLSDVEIHEVEKYLADRYGLYTPKSLPPVVTPAVELLGETATVTMTSPVAGADIYYTTNGTTPDTNSTLYTGSFQVSTATTVKAIAVEDGLLASDVVEKNYVFDADTTLIPRDKTLLWLRADQRVIDDGFGFIERWGDLSGRNHDALMATSANRPTLVASQINGKPSIVFDGTDDHMVLKQGFAEFGDGLTIVTVSRPTNTSGAWHRIFEFGSGSPDGNINFCRDANTNNLRFYLCNGGTANSFVITNAIAVNTWHAHLGMHDGIGAVSLYRNGGTPVTGTMAALQEASRGTNYLARSVWSSSDGYHKGDIAEMIVMNRDLTEQERLDVFGYLSKRYAFFTAALPTAGSSIPAITYSSGQTVELTHPYPGTKIYYTTDGSDPDETDLLYTGALNISSTTTIKTRAYRPGWEPSAINVLEFVIDPTTADVSRTGLHAWLRTDTGIELDGSSKVETWKDQSGNNRYATEPSAANRPTVSATAFGASNDEPGVNFLRSSSQRLEWATMADPMASGTVTTWMFVFRTNHNTGGSSDNTIYGSIHQGYAHPLRISTTASGGIWVSLYRTQGSVGQYSQAFGSGYNDNEPHVLTLTTDNNNVMEVAVDGLPLGTIPDAVIPWTYATASRASLGCQITSDNVSWFYGSLFNGDIGEVIVYSRSLSPEERLDAEQYLALRNGINLKIRPPEVTPLSGLQGSEVEVVATAPRQDFTVVYTTDGNEPNASSTVYTGPITVSTSGTYKFKCLYEDLESPTVTRQFTFDASTDPVPRDGLQLWLRSDLGVTKDGSNVVSDWQDQAAAQQHHAVQSTSTWRPVYYSSVVNGHPTIRFDGSDDRLQITDSADLKPTKITAFVVGRRTGGGLDGTYFVRTEGSGWDDGYGLTHDNSSSTVKFWINHSANNKTTSTLTAGDFGMMTAAYNLTARTLRVNAGNEGSNSYTTAIDYDTGLFSVGGHSSASSMLGGDIAEVLFYDRELTEGERYEVENYLATRYALPAFAPPPVFSPKGGTFAASLNATLTEPSGSGTIRYTTDGSDPDGSSTAYSSAINVASTTTIKARNYITGMQPSEIVTAKFVIDSSLEIPLTDLVLWLRADEGVEKDGSDFVDRWLDQSGNGTHARQDYQNTTAKRPKWIASTLTGYNSVAFDGVDDFLQFAPGFNTFASGVAVVAIVMPSGATSGAALLELGDGAAADNLVLARSGTTPYLAFAINDGTSTSTLTSTASLVQNAFHLAVAQNDGSGTMNQWLNGAAAGQATGTVDPRAVAREINYLGRQTAAGANTWWGNIAEILVYSRPLTANERQEFLDYANAKYGIQAATLVAPTFSPVAGSYGSSQSVTLSESSGLSSVTIRYTLDGSEPTASSPAYSSALAVNRSMVVKARCFKTNYAPSAVASATYWIDDADQDGISDTWEDANGLNDTDPDDAAEDADGDGLSNLGEFLQGSDPADEDSNDDGIEDGLSVAMGINPASSDPDGDGLTTAQEIALGTKPFTADSDGDGYDDGVDDFPMDPTRHTGSGGSASAPVITLDEPSNAVEVP